VFLFVNPGAKLGTAAQRYCTQLSELVRNFEVANHFLRLSHFNAHGIHKGSGTHASSASTMPPSFVAVAAHGEWSIGKILDVYLRTDAKVDMFMERLNKSVADAVDAKVEAEGGVNSSILKSTIQELKD
jgi:hypothetical protein